MDNSTPLNKKKKESCFSLKCSVIISYLISITSNILLVVILFLSEHGYKWPGFMFHGVVFTFTGLSLRSLTTFSKTSLIRYQSWTRYYALSLVVTGLFYIGVLIYNFVTSTDMDLFYFFFFCIVIWCVFHGLFVSIIQSFIKVLEDRPVQGKPYSKTVDKDLQKMMLSTNTNTN